MNTFNQNYPDRRAFFKQAAVLSLSTSVSGLIGEHSKMAGIATDPAEPDDPMIEIRPGSKITVLVSVFTVQPENEEKLIQLFEEGTLSIFSKQPGYISSSIHRGSDAKRLVLYGQWESQESIDTFRKKPEIGQYFQKVKELATFESIVCTDIPFVHHK